MWNSDWVKQMAAVFKCFTSVIHFSTFPKVNLVQQGIDKSKRPCKFLDSSINRALLPRSSAFYPKLLNKFESVIPSSNRSDVIKLLAFFAPTTTWLTEISCKIRIGDTKRDHICGYWRQVLREGITGRWESKATNFSYKISTRDVIYNAINIHKC